ncbi:low temperature requirement protein A [Streptosporangium sp. NPDC000396]|uniref:low temperature requirement protein A n=1 Tax=Streptosporangium sp. NPDC000396 TaxID=3366185 RepID=UPI0036C8166A
MRARGAGAATVTPFELFFDLVYVFAVTQLSHHLLDELTVIGAAKTLLLLLAVWWAWNYTSWMTNWFDPAHPRIRLVLAAVMLASLVMSAFLPEAFGERAVWFAGAYVAIQVGRTMSLVVLSRGTALRLTFSRILLWHVVTGVLWLYGAVAGGAVQTGLWVLAIILEYLAPWHGYRMPGLGRAHTSEWTIEGAHMAERCQLFMIIALGESILMTGATLGKLGPSPAAVAAFAVAFVAAVGMWWIYFDRTAEAAAEEIAASDDPGRLGRSAYAVNHIPMVAGIIVTAVGNELVIAHPAGHTEPAVTAVILGGAGLYLVGHALFTRTVFRRVPWTRLAAVAALVALVPVSLIVSPLVLSTATALVLLGLAVADARIRRDTTIPA